MRKAFAVVLLSIILGCAELDPPLSSNSIATATLTITSEQTSIDTPTSPSSTNDAINRQEVISPQLKNICPEQQLIPIEELELSSDLRLLLLPGSVEAYPPTPGKPLSISLENLSPITIFDDELYEFSVSPDHKWIYFNRLGIDGKYPKLWISSLDGKTQWPVIDLEGRDFAGYAVWVSEQEIFIIGSPNKSEISALNPWEFMPFMGINPFTFEERQLTYLVRSPEDGLFFYGIANLEMHPFGMYGRLNRVDFIYDYEEDKALPVFSWLNEVNPFDMQFMKSIWVYDVGAFAVTIPHPDGIDLALNLNLQSAGENSQYDDVMKRIIFPKSLLPASVLGIVPNSDWIALQRFDFFDSSKGENWFYVLDYSNQIVYDYCFDLKDSVKRVKFSPDGKFVAFSLENFAADLEQDQHYVAILNLEIGTVTYLKGYVIIDWGVAEP
jgi:hypothetical protein